MTEEGVLCREAIEFVTDLQRRFGARRAELLARRRQRRAEIARTGLLDFLPETREVRESEWTVPPPPPGLSDRRVEITGPTDRKMAINALNSTAKVWLADLEDANTPHWANVVTGQVNLYDAVRGSITYDAPDGRRYALRTDRRLATIVVRPRGWHLDERHLTVDGSPTAGALVDFGLHVFHNAHESIARGSGPYYYLPKLESHREARLWNDVFDHAEAALHIPRGTIRATVLIETITAAFEMDEILYELGSHAAGLNAGRWDYLFSIIKTFRERAVLPDRAAITMTAPFLRAYTELLVATCHRRGAAAIGGMSAFIPSGDAAQNAAAFGRVRADKEREANDGFDGSWVAHPKLVPVCQEVFDGVLGPRDNQLDRTRDDVTVRAAQLLDFTVVGGEVTSAGLRTNVSVALRYLEAWLRGVGAVAINDLMEDAATAEISRAQVWQWVHQGVRLADSGEAVTAALVGRIEDEELAAIRDAVGADAYQAGRWPQARTLFERGALADEFVDFLTVPAYEVID
ncbi:malate synthase A [Micromonospora sp. NPDC048898]|uniref:malate synthase A n=1 Tax=Micromonospora sp. NPDC048898 TaxID=3364260 RepID=UPI0037211253